MFQGVLSCANDNEFGQVIKRNTFDSIETSLLLWFHHTLKTTIIGNLWLHQDIPPTMLFLSNKQSETREKERSKKSVIIIPTFELSQNEKRKETLFCLLFSANLIF